MITLRTVAELRDSLAGHRRAGRTIGLVPTMGALHEGHLSLIRRARGNTDVVVMSLFVNPAQFNESTDLAAYPRDEQRDAALAEQNGVDIIFAPSVDEVYPPGFSTTVSVSGLTETLEGAHRGRGHFDGVTTVVTKLFNMAGPDVAYFGQKDAQQATVIKRLVSDLDIPVRIEICPTVRDPDGLALSSRNAHLSPAERERATALHRALQGAVQTLANGERDPAVVAARARGELSDAGIEPEYLELVDPDSLAPVQEIDRAVLAVVAARVGTTRLIDNQPLSTIPSNGGKLKPKGLRRQQMSATPRISIPHDLEEPLPMTLPRLAEKKRLGERIVMVTAYDYPSAQVAQEAGVDVVLVGDSGAMTVLGYPSTVPVSTDEMLMLASAVRRGLKTPFLVGDLPFGSYEASDEQAIATAQRFVKEAGCDAVKLERGGTSVQRARAIVDAGIPVMGHVGLTPQTATALGGYKAQGRTAANALNVARDALALQEAGCFSIVFEAIPAAVTEIMMERIEIPVIGIGAGPATDGQVLVFHDLLGIYDGHAPRFAKRFGEVKAQMIAGVAEYAAEVRSGAFPAPEHTYSIDDEQLAGFAAEF